MNDVTNVTEYVYINTGQYHDTCMAVIIANVSLQMGYINSDHVDSSNFVGDSAISFSSDEDDFVVGSVHPYSSCASAAKEYVTTTNSSLTCLSTSMTTQSVRTLSNAVAHTGITQQHCTNFNAPIIADYCMMSASFSDSTSRHFQ